MRTVYPCRIDGLLIRTFQCLLNLACDRTVVDHPILVEHDGSKAHGHECLCKSPFGGNKEVACAVLSVVLCEPEGSRRLKLVVGALM